MAKRLVWLTRFDDNAPIVLNFDGVIYLMRVDNQDPESGTLIYSTAGRIVDVKETLEEVIDLAEKA